MIDDLRRPRRTWEGSLMLLNAWVTQCSSAASPDDPGRRSPAMRGISVLAGLLPQPFNSARVGQTNWVQAPARITKPNNPGPGRRRDEG